MLPRNENLYRYIVETPWAILPSFLTLLTERVVAGDETATDLFARGAPVPRATPAGGGSLAVLPLLGPITQRGDLMSFFGIGTSTQQFTSMFRAAMADLSISGIIIDCDTPGGTVSGVDELASEIYKARGAKPIAAVANTLMASAGYWIASAADQLFASPSAGVGSIGVLTVHMDASKALEMEGVKPTLISQGRYKGEASPYGPLSDEARANIQASVDDHYGAFTRAVARNRGADVASVRSGYGEGRLLNAQKAKSDGMVDGVATLDDVIGKMARAVAGNPRPAQRAEASDELRERRLRLLTSARR